MGEGALVCSLSVGVNNIQCHFREKIRWCILESTFLGSAWLKLPTKIRKAPGWDVSCSLMCRQFVQCVTPAVAVRAQRDVNSIEQHEPTVCVKYSSTVEPSVITVDTVSSTLGFTSIDENSVHSAAC